MKTNPSCTRPDCPREFAETLNFCNLCGARLSEALKSEVASEDPFKTVVGGQSAPVAEDPFRTVVGQQAFGGPLPEIGEKQPELPESPMEASPFSQPSEPPIPQPASPPVFSEPSLNAPNFGNLSGKAEEAEEAAPTLIASEPPEMPPAPSPFDSPFAQAPPASPFDIPESPKFDAPPFKEPDPVFTQQNDPFASPFNPPQDNWAPPPVPVQGWQDSPIGANTPFQPPPALAPQGQDQTLPIISLVCGILGLCCGFLGIAALITGYMGRNNAINNPQQYTGQGLATAGMILGGISLLLTVLWIILQLVGALAGGIR